MIGNRQFLQSASDTRNVMREVLQLIFASELIQPSRCLWLVSPWLRNIPILDNSLGDHLKTGHLWSLQNRPLWMV